MTQESGAPTLLLVGGAGGLLGRAVLEEFAPDHRIVSVHPHRASNEERPDVRWIRHDASQVRDWGSILRGVDKLVLLAWYRSGGKGRFQPLADGLVRAVRGAEEAGVGRLLHVSVPDAPEDLERSLPYLYAKREVDRVVETCSIPWSIVRPTMLFGARDRLTTVMMRLMHRYHRFPMFGTGDYHVSPVAARDVATVIRSELERCGREVVSVGGPKRWLYRELTDRMFGALGLAPRYVRLGPAASVRLARLMETVGLSTIYAYEVRWLLSDMLGLEPYVRLARPLAPIEPFLDLEAARLTGRPATRDGDRPQTPAG